MLELFHPHLLLFFSGPLIEFVCKSESWVILDIMMAYIVQPLALFIDPEHILKLTSVEVAIVLPLFD